MSHIRIIIYSFECDEPGCGETIEATPPYEGGQLLVSARREIHTRDRWDRRDGRDLCPKHAEALRISETYGRARARSLT